MYKIEIKYEKHDYKIHAIKALKYYFGYGLQEAKTKIEQELSNDYVWMNLAVSESEFEDAYWGLLSASFHIRRTQNLNAKPDIAYIAEHFSEMWKEELGEHVLEKGKMYGDVCYSIFTKDLSRFVLIDDDVIADYVTKKMLEAGVKIIDKPHEKED